MIKAAVFDAYGTIYDVYSVFQKCESFYPGKGEQISQIWRLKQLQYSWQRTLMGNYQDFWEMTIAGLKYALESLKLDYDETIIQDVLAKYYSLQPYDDVAESMSLFAPRKLAILSNGAPHMLDQVVKNNGHDKYFDAVISIDPLRMFKPRPEVYALAVACLRVKKEEVLFVSSNGWDAAGAKWYGYTAGWVNRNGDPVEKLGVEPDYNVRTLLELAKVTKGL